MTGRDSDNEDLRAAHDLNNVLADYFRHSPDKSMIVKWTLQAEVIDHDGQQAMWTIAMPGMAIWEKQSFTRYALRYYDWVQHKANEEGEG